MQPSSSSSSLLDGEEELPVGVTIRSRRRVQRLTTSSNNKKTNDAKNGEKENERAKSKPSTSSSSSSAGASSKRGKGKSVRAVAKVKEQESHTDDHDNHQSSMLLFRTALHSLPSSDNDDMTIRNHPGLVDQILRASKSISSSSSTSSSKNSIITASLALEEHEAALLRDCRTMIKSWTSTTQQSTKVNAERMLDHLHVVVHILRALATFQYEIQQQEASLKLLYHAVTLLSDHHFGKSLISSSSSESQLRSMTICVAAFEATGILLQRYSVPSITNQQKAICFVVVSKHDANSDDDNVSSYLLQQTFPTPMERKRTTKSSSSSSSSAASQVGTLPLRKVLALGLQIAMAAFMTLAKVESTPLLAEAEYTSSSSSHVVADFGAFPANLIRRATELSSRGQMTCSTNLFNKILLPWIHFFAKSIGPESFVDILLHGKRVHRCFWEAAAASQVTTSSASISKDEAPIVALQLRQRSIMALLLCFTDTTNMLPLSCLRSTLADKVLDVACTYAWKAVASFRGKSAVSTNSSQTQDPLVGVFHQKVGSALDVLCGCGDASDETFCLSYAEYCAYRAIHLGPFHSNVTFLFERHKGKESVSTSLGHATFNVVLLALTLGRRLEASLNGYEAPDEESDTFGNDKVQPILNHFQSTVLESSDVGCLTRCYKMLSLVSFPRCIYNVLKDTTTTWEPSSNDCWMLYHAGRILADCIGPLCVQLLSCQSQTQAEKLRCWEASVESFIRALTALVRIPTDRGYMDITTTDDVQAAAEAVATKLVLLLTGESGLRDAPADCIEKVAKTFSVISKRFFEHGEQCRALLPMICSVQLFTRLSSLVNGGDNKQQLAVRWFHLASAFQANSMQEEACLALVTALTVLVQESSRNGSSFSTSLDLIHYFASLTKGGFVTGSNKIYAVDISAQIIGRLVSLIVDLEPAVANLTESKVRALSVSSAIQLLGLSVKKRNRGSRETELRARFESECGVHFNVCGVMRVMFLADSPERGDEVTNAETILTFQVKVMMDIIHGAGLRYQRMCSDDPERVSSTVKLDMLLEEFQSLLRLIPPLTRKLTSLRNESSSSLIASFYVVAAHSLHPNFGLGMMAGKVVGTTCEEKIAQPPSVEVAERILNKAEAATTKEETLSRTEWDAMKAALSVVISSYHAQLNRTKDVGYRHFRFCLEATQCLEKVAEVTPVAEASRMCLLWELIQFHDRLRFDGKWLAAACMAQCIKGLATSVANGEDSWSQALLISTLLKADVPLIDDDDLKCTMRIGLAFHCALIENEWLQLAKTELSCFQMQLDLFVAIQHDFVGMTEKASEAYKQMNQQGSHHLVQWVSGSIAESLSEIFERSGDVHESLRWVRRCARTCRHSLDTLKNRQRDNAFNAPGACPLWVQACVATIFVRLSERHRNCLQRISLLYGKLGNHRKSEGYALMAGSETSLLRIESHGIQSFASSILTATGDNEDLASIRLLVQVKAQAMALDAVVASFAELDYRKVDDQVIDADVFVQHRMLQRISGLITVGDSLFGGLALREQSAFEGFYNEAGKVFNMLSEKLSLISTQRLPRLINDLYHNRVLQITSSRLKLREARSIIYSSADHKKAVQLCSEVLDYPWSPLDCRAWASFYIGIVLLQEARTNGCLYRLWSGQTDPLIQQRVAPLTKAREYFLSALRFNGVTPSLLTRDVLRSLALATGPVVDTNQYGFSAATLIQTSLGISPRQSVFGAVVDNAEQSSNQSYDGDHARSEVELLRALDTNFLDWNERNRKVATMYEIVKAQLPPNWRALSMCLCPTGEMLLTSLEVVQGELESAVACIFPEPGWGELYHNKIYNDILTPLDRLIETNQLQLRGSGDADEVEQSVNDSAKRRWWKMRSRLDCELGELIDHTERDYFSGKSLQQLIFGASFNSIEDLSDFSCGNLADKFEAALRLENDYKSPHIQDDLDLEDTSTKLRPTSIFGPSQAGERGAESVIDQAGDPCLFLILDENLHRFPFEGMSCFGGRAVCRVPSLPFVVLPLVEASDSTTATDLDPFGASFILDPESNLSETKNRLLPVLQSISMSNHWGWKGVTGSTPSRDFIEQALTRERGLMLYCGHGAGQVFYPRKSVERLLGSSCADDLGEINAPAAGARRCKASVILMGCSSGRLMSVNRKNSKSLENIPVHFEPEGIALSYLSAGSPCVVGNLWDVTDRDIDRYSIALLNSFLTNEGGDLKVSLAQCVAEARAACKLPYLVGCAPVSYGIPVVRSRVEARRRTLLEA